MKQDAQQATSKIIDLKPEHIFSFPDGLPGFEKVKRFAILTDPQEAPFGKLAAVDFDLCFYVVIPWAVFPEYAPDIDEEDLKKIESPEQEETLILAIANIPKEKPQESTMNLAAPIIINVKKGVGRQVVINNFNDFNAKHALWQK